MKYMPPVKVVVLSAITLFWLCLIFLGQSEHVGIIIGRHRNARRSGRKEIIFIETQDVPLCLTSRQACAVESTAHHNPGAVILLLARQELNETKKCLYNNVVKGLPNVRVQVYDVEYLVRGTPLESWWAGRRSERISDKYPLSHLSDALRLAVMSARKCLYLDLDFITLRSLDPIFETGTCIARESDESLNGAMAASLDYNSFFEECMFEFKETFNGDNWAENGPGLLNRIIAKKGCKITYQSCEGVRIFPCELIYPVHYKSWTLLFSTADADKELVSKALTNAFTLHLWNYLSKNTLSNTSASNAINRIAGLNCPLSFGISKRDRGEF